MRTAWDLRGASSRRRRNVEDVRGQASGSEGSPCRKRVERRTLFERRRRFIGAGSRSRTAKRQRLPAISLLPCPPLLPSGRLNPLCAILLFVVVWVSSPHGSKKRQDLQLKSTAKRVRGDDDRVPIIGLASSAEPSPASMVDNMCDFAPKDLPSSFQSCFI